MLLPISQTAGCAGNPPDMFTFRSHAWLCFLALSFLCFGSSALGSFALSKTSSTVVIAPGYNHIPIEVALLEVSDLSALTVDSDVPWAIPQIDEVTGHLRVDFQTEDLLSNHTATIRLSDNETTVDFFLSASVSPLDVYRLTHDLQRSLVYGIHRAGIERGAVIAFDAVAERPVKSVTVGFSPTDFVIDDERSELLVINAVGKTISVVDLDTFEVKDTIHLTTYQSWGDPGETTANIELGPEDIIYYIDGSWGPVLHSFDRSIGQVLQRITFLGEEPGNATGFMDIAVNPDRSGMVAMPQFGWSAGGHTGNIGQYDIEPDGTVTFIKTTTIPGFQRKPFEAPALMSADGQLAVTKTVSVAADDTDQLLSSFPSAIWSMAPNASIVATADKLYRYDTGEELVSFGTPLPSYSRNDLARKAQVFTADYQKFIHFNNETEELEVIDLVATIGLDLLGQTLSPKNGAVIVSPETLDWSPIEGILEYDLYFGTDEGAIGSATTDSSAYLGRVSDTTSAVSLPLLSGETYFWRVDPVTRVGPQSGPIYSFTVSDVSLELAEIEVVTVQGHQNFEVAIGVTSSRPADWSASAAQQWIRTGSSSDVSPTEIVIELDASGLEPGRHVGEVEVTTPSGIVLIPVDLMVEPLAITHLASDRRSSKVYAISEDPDQLPRRAYLLEVDAQSEEILRVAPVGADVTALSISYEDNHLYLSNWRSGQLRRYDLADLALIETFPFTAPGGGSFSDDDPYRVAAGRAGRVVVEGQDQWIDIVLYDTVNGLKLDAESEREGGGLYDPRGRYYYHGDNDSSGSQITKYDTVGDQFTPIANARPSGNFGFGSRTVVLSEDGQRLFWAGVVFDEDLQTEWAVEQIIYSTSGDGRYAFGESDIFDVNLRRRLFSMPVKTRVSCFNTVSEKLVVQEQGALRYYSLAAPISHPTPNPTISATAVNSVQIAWDDRSLEDNFVIEQRVSGALAWEGGRTVSANSTEVTISGLSEGTSYEFRVRATSSEHSSQWSEPIEATTGYRTPSSPLLSGFTNLDPPAASLSWNLFDDLTSFQIIRQTVGQSDAAVIAKPVAGETRYVDTTVQHGVSYEYTIVAIRFDLESPVSRSALVDIPQLVPPVAPSNFVVEVVSSSELSLEWDDVSGETGYRLERVDDGLEWVSLAILEADTVQYSDDTVLEGNQYQYRVFAFNSEGDSPPSLQVGAIPQQVVTVVEDRFVNSASQSVWDVISGAFVVEGLRSNPDDEVLIFDSDVPREVVTRSFRVSSDTTLSFDLKLQETTGVLASIWDDHEVGEEVVVSYRIGFGPWLQMSVLSVFDTGSGDWRRHRLEVPESTDGEAISIRIAQPVHSGMGRDFWAIDNVKVQTEASRPTAPAFVLGSAQSPRSVGLFWVEGQAVGEYLVQKQEVFGAWQTIATVPGAQTFYVDEGLTPSTFYRYRLIASSEFGISEPSQTVLVETQNAFSGWLFENFNVADPDEIPTEVELINYLREYGFPTRGSILGENLILPAAKIFEGRFCVEFTRRRAENRPGVRYVTEFSSDMKTWVEGDHIVSSSQIDETWETVLIADPEAMLIGRNYGRVRILQD